MKVLGVLFGLLGWLAIAVSCGHSGVTKVEQTYNTFGREEVQRIAESDELEGFWIEAHNVAGEVKQIALEEYNEREES